MKRLAALLVAALGARGLRAEDAASDDEAVSPYRRFATPAAAEGALPEEEAGPETSAGEAPTAEAPAATEGAAPEPVPAAPAAGNAGWTGSTEVAPAEGAASSGESPASHAEGAAPPAPEPAAGEVRALDRPEVHPPEGGPAPVLPAAGRPGRGGEAARLGRGEGAMRAVLSLSVTRAWAGLAELDGALLLGDRTTVGLLAGRSLPGAQGRAELGLRAGYAVVGTARRGLSLVGEAAAGIADLEGDATVRGYEYRLGPALAGRATLPAGLSAEARAGLASVSTVARATRGEGTADETAWGLRPVGNLTVGWVF